MGETAGTFFSPGNLLFLWIAGGVAAALFLFIICDAIRHRRKKHGRQPNFHYTMTGRAEDWSKKHPEGEADVSKTSRKAPKRK